MGACGKLHRGQRYAPAARGPRAVEEPKHVWSLRAREPGDLCVTNAKEADVGSGFWSGAMREMEDCWLSGVGPAGMGVKPPRSCVS